MPGRGCGYRFAQTASCRGLLPAAATRSPANTPVSWNSQFNVTFTMQSAPAIFATSRASSWQELPSRTRSLALGDDRNSGP